MSDKKKKPIDYKLTERIRNYFFAKPNVQWTATEIATRFELKPYTTNYHLQKLIKAGALEKRPGYKYIANPAYKTVEQIREEIAQLPPRVQSGKPWSSDDHSDAISPGTNFVYFKRHLDSMRERIVTSLTKADLDAFDELLKLAFGA
jgi:DNA-binding MarR family transcriptional regulator